MAAPRPHDPSEAVAALRLTAVRAAGSRSSWPVCCRSSWALLMSEAPTDGRVARGRARRRLLTDAALAVLARDGMGGLTHRSVAAEAGVPLASASYHFTGIDDLVMTAIRQANDEFIAAMQATGNERSLAGLARLLAEELVMRPHIVVAAYEFYLLAARRPQLRSIALAWLDVAADTYVPGLAGPQRRAFLATVEGVVLHGLLGAHQADPEEIEATLRAATPART